MTSGIMQVIHMFVRRWHIWSAWYNHGGWGEQGMWHVWAGRQKFW